MPTVFPSPVRTVRPAIRNADTRVNGRRGCAPSRPRGASSRTSACNGAAACPRAGSTAHASQRCNTAAESAQPDGSGGGGGSARARVLLFSLVSFCLALALHAQGAHVMETREHGLACADDILRTVFMRAQTKVFRTTAEGGLAPQQVGSPLPQAHFRSPSAKTASRR